MIAAAPDQRAARPTRRRAVIAVHAAVGAALVAAGAVLWSTRSRLLDTGSIADTIGQRISHQVGQPVTVDCPDTVPREPRVTFRCRVVQADGLSRTVVVTVTDGHGAVTWRTRT